MNGETHNVHMLLPKRLWSAAKRQAILEGTTLTYFVCEALEALLATKAKAKEKEDKKHE